MRIMEEEKQEEDTVPKVIRFVKEEGRWNTVMWILMQKELVWPSTTLTYSNI